MKQFFNIVRPLKKLLAFKVSSPQEKTEAFSESDRFKACGVFKTATAYKVVTEYNLDYGYYRSAEPFFIVKAEKELLKAIKDALEASWHVGTCINLSTKDYLKRLKERSFKHLYHNSTSCFIRLKGNMLEITKYELHPSGRYLQENPDKVNLLIDEVGWDGALQVILNILNQENDSKSR